MIVTAPGHPPFNGASWFSARKLKLSEAGSNFRLSPNFVLSEVRSKDGTDEVLVDEFSLAALEYLRTAIGNRPIIINSAYRTIKHNEAVGGEVGSEHTTGHAFDIRSPGVDPINIALHAHNAGFRSVGLYSNFVHVGTRGTKQARWFGKGVEPFAWSRQGHGEANDSPQTDMPDGAEILPIAGYLPGRIGKMVSLAPVTFAIISIGGLIYMIRR